MSNDLVRYEHLKSALAECIRVDEAADIRDKAAAIEAYARQRDDTVLEVGAAELKLRACRRLGELSRDLDKATREGPAGNYKLPTGGKSKADVLASAGISTSEAHRLEQLAGGRDALAMAAASAAAELVFAKSRHDNKPATMAGLRGAVEEAIVATLGPPPALTPQLWRPASRRPRR